MTEKNQLEVSGIRAGTVIDHISSEYTFHVARILQIEEVQDTVLVASNLVSSRLGKKGLIKVENKTLTQEMVNKIALISPRATLNIIEDYKVVQKIKVEIPDQIDGILRCFNPNCVTNAVSPVPSSRTRTLFDTESRHPLRLRCHHCERVMTRADIGLL